MEPTSYIYIVGADLNLRKGECYALCYTDVNCHTLFGYLVLYLI